MKKRKQKRFITLIEIMIVILLIGLIGGALAFNMRGSMDEGKAFKTRQNQNRIEEILYLEEARGEESLAQIVDRWDSVVQGSPLVKGNDIIKDGWKETFSVVLEEGEVKVTSNRLKAYESKKKS